MVAVEELMADDAGGVEEVAAEDEDIVGVAAPVDVDVSEDVHDESVIRAPAPDAARPKSARR